MRMERLDRAAFIEVYEQCLLRDFIPSEQKPLGLLLSLEAAGRYKGYGFYEGEALLGYAFLAFAAASPDVLLDYFAVCPGQRGQGKGQACFQQLAASLSPAYRALLLEVEDPEQVGAKADLRRRRVRFYRRCGVELRALRCHLQQEYYVIMVKHLAGTISDREVQAALTDIYLAFFGEAHLAEKASFGEEPC